MSDEHVELLKNLDRLLFEDAGETSGDVRRRLESEGVDVKGLIDRVTSAAGAAYREALVDQAKEEETRRRQSRGSVFGHLAQLSREKLLELIRAAEAGEYGGAIMARCRNQKVQDLSETDLRTFLEDLESTLQ
jgi:hypothetical protein